MYNQMLELSGENTTIDLHVNTPVFLEPQDWISGRVDANEKVKELTISDVTLNVRKQRKFAVTLIDMFYFQVCALL